MGQRTGRRAMKKAGPPEGGPARFIASMPDLTRAAAGGVRRSGGLRSGRCLGGSRGSGSGRSSGSGLGRNGLLDRTLRDDALTTAGTTGAATFHHDLTATARSAARSGLAARTAVARGRLARRSGFGSTVAATAMTSKQAAVATLTLAVAAVQTGEKTAMTATMAAVTGHRTRITADERDADEREEHRERKAEETLHY